MKLASTAYNSTRHFSIGNVIVTAMNLCNFREQFTLSQYKN